MDSIKEWVGAYLARTNKTKTELAEDLGMSRTAFYSKMYGPSEFTLSEAGNLAKILGISTDSMLASPFDLAVDKDSS